MLRKQSSTRTSLRMGEASSSSSAERMEFEEHDMKIPQELLQEIFSRMPFPEILKVQEISKCWKAYFQNELKPKLPAPKPPKQAEVVPIFTWARYYPFSIKIYENQLFYDSDS